MNAEDKGRWWVVGSAWEGRIDKVEGKCQSSLGHWWVNDLMTFDTYLLVYQFFLPKLTL
jgi:hypothetical protein